MIITLLLFSILAQAEEISSEKYCFSSARISLNAKQKLTAIQVPDDVVTSDENCLVVQMRPHRRELIQRFVLNSFQGTTVSFSSEVQRGSCKLKVEKVKTKITGEMEAGISQHSIVLNQTKINGNASETIQIQTIKDFELAVDQDEIRGSCRYINSNRYEISLTVRKNARPVVSTGLPLGTIVVLNRPPTDQETMVLQTQLQLSRGEKIDIGVVIKALRHKNKTVDVKHDSIHKEGAQSSSEDVWLSLQ